MNIYCYYLSKQEKNSTMRSSTMLVIPILLFFFAYKQASADIFTNSFLVRLKHSADKELADKIANRNGFINLGSVRIL